jgi:hypothetical protein
MELSVQGLVIEAGDDLAAHERRCLDNEHRRCTPRPTTDRTDWRDAMPHTVATHLIHVIAPVEAAADAVRYANNQKTV